MDTKKLRDKKYYQEHKEQIKATNHKYYHNNRDKVLEASREYRSKNYDRVNVKTTCEYCNRIYIARMRSQHESTDIHKRKGILKCAKRTLEQNKRYRQNRLIKEGNLMYNYKIKEECDEPFILSFV